MKILERILFVALVIVVIVLLCLIITEIGHSADSPRIGVWVNGECRFDLPYEAMLAAGYEPCPELLYLNIDEDNQTLRKESYSSDQSQPQTAPEPATMLMVGSGLIWIATRRRSKE